MVALSTVSPAAATNNKPKPDFSWLVVSGDQKCDQTNGVTVVTVTVKNKWLNDLTMLDSVVFVNRQKKAEYQVKWNWVDGKEKVIPTGTFAHGTLTPGVLTGTVTIKGSLRGVASVGVWAGLPEKASDETKKDFDRTMVKPSEFPDCKHRAFAIGGTFIFFDGKCYASPVVTIVTPGCDKLDIKVTNPANGAPKGYIWLWTATKAAPELKVVAGTPVELPAPGTELLIKDVPNVGVNLTGVVTLSEQKTDVELAKQTELAKVAYVAPANCAAKSLPVTGSKTGLIAGGAALLVVAGGVLFFVARRRRVTFSS